MSDTQPIIPIHDEPATYEIRLKGHLPIGGPGGSGRSPSGWMRTARRG